MATSIEQLQEIVARIEVAMEKSELSRALAQERIERAQEKTEFAIQEVQRVQEKTERTLDKTLKILGGVGRSIGDIVTTTGVAGKTICLAAAGMVFDDDARKIAEEKGIYLVEVNEDYNNDKIKITSPRTVGKW
jgi:hypothetical protein